MDPALRLRLDTFRAADGVPTQVVDFVERELAALDPEAVLDDEEAGVFVSHVVMALARLLRGDNTVTEPDEGMYAEVIEEHPSAAVAARIIADRAEVQFGHPLPAPELKFLAIHIALLTQRLSKETS